MYDLLILYRAHHPQLKPSTAEAYRYALRALEQHLGRTPDLGDLSESVLLSFVSVRLRKGSQQTVKRELGTLLRLWRFGWNRKIIDRDPSTAAIPAIHIDRDPPIALTPGELKAVFESCRMEEGSVRGTSISKAAWWYALVQVLYWSGGRISAVLSLGSGDLDHKTGWLRLSAKNSKTGSGQLIQISREAVQAVEAMRWIGDRIFTNPYQRRWLWTSWKRIIRRAGLPPDRRHGFHCIRRTTATLATANASIDLAKRILGHSTEAMTQLYVDPRQCGASLVGILPRIG